jgi:hypothetical protein
MLNGGLGKSKLQLWIKKISAVKYFQLGLALWVRIEKSLKNRKWAKQAKEWPTHYSPAKKNVKVCHLQQDF